MKLRDYMREKVPEISYAAFFLFVVSLMAGLLKVQGEMLAAVWVLVLLGLFVLWGIDYYKKKKFYTIFSELLTGLDQKYLITEMVKAPEFFEGRFLCEALYEIDKSMKTHINQESRKQEEFKEFVELWIHEIKVPLSGLSLMNYNHSTDFAAQKLLLKRLEFYVEQILFFSRADSPKDDFLMKQTKLDAVVNRVLLHHKEMLIASGISVRKEGLGDCPAVMTDAKWLEFILGQIVNNSIKYRKPEGEGEERHIVFCALYEEEKVILVAEDNGIGIDEADLPRIFEKSFTGGNGRTVRHATGMGLYICRKLCDRLGHEIRAESVKGSFTRVMIVFGKEEWYSGVV